MSELLQKSDINPEDLVALLKEREAGKAEFVLVDVREQMEYDEGYIKGIDALKPTSTFQNWGQDFFDEVKDKTVIFSCRSGARSGQVVQAFRQNGHNRSINLSGGIMSYPGEITKD
ncbi:MAG: rhodanese-like domain-containing protein [Sulfurovaceae bacterium]|nr:rhodanese-like domain-containing protein [Sulfurovaceae bacterium]